MRRGQRRREVLKVRWYRGDMLGEWTKVGGREGREGKEALPSREKIDLYVKKTPSSSQEWK